MLGDGGLVDLEPAGDPFLTVSPEVMKGETFLLAGGVNGGSSPLGPPASSP